MFSQHKMTNRDFSTFGKCYNTLTCLNKAQAVAACLTTECISKVLSLFKLITLFPVCFGSLYMLTYIMYQIQSSFLKEFPWSIGQTYNDIYFH